MRTAASDLTGPARAEGHSNETIRPKLSAASRKGSERSATLSPSTAWLRLEILSTGIISRSGDKGHPCRSSWRAHLTHTRALVVRIPNVYKPTKPDGLPYKHLSGSAHRFPSGLGVKQDHGDPFGLSVVRAVVFHPGRHERA